MSNLSQFILSAFNAITVTSINKVALTQPATLSTLTIINGKTLTISKTISFTAADDTGVYTLPTGTKTLVATDVTTLSALTTVGALNSGSITSGFGAIDVGTDAISGGTITGTTGNFSDVLSANGAGSPFVRVNGGATGNPFYSFQQQGIEKAYIQYANATSSIDFGFGSAVAHITSTGLNSTAIGQTTPAAGSFTTLSATKASAGDAITFGSTGGVSGYLYSGTSIVNFGFGAGGGGAGYSLSSTAATIYSPDQTKTAALSNTGLAVTGTLSSTLDATIYGITVGRGAGAVSTNTAVGASALAANTTGSYNTVFGHTAAFSNTTGQYNVAIGQETFYTNTTGSNNTAIGRNAVASNSTGSNNVGVGYQALLLSTTASNNTAVGYQAGYTNTTGTYNVFIGHQAGYATTGSSNTFVGKQSNGNGSGELVTTGSKNSIFGGYNGNQGSLDIRTASNYIVLSDGDGNPRGYFDNSGYFYLGTSNVDIRVPSTGGIAHFGYMTSGSQLQVSYDSVSAGVSLGSGATSWGTFSDERLKNVTGTYSNALADIAQIQPVKFTWKNDPDSKPQVGVIAQSVQSVVPEAMDSTTYEMNGDTEYLQVRYTELIPLMIASIQELKAEFDAYKLTHP